MASKRALAVILPFALISLGLGLFLGLKDMGAAPSACALVVHDIYRPGLCRAGATPTVFRKATPPVPSTPRPQAYPVPAGLNRQPRPPTLDDYKKELALIPGRHLLYAPPGADERHRKIGHVVTGVGYNTTLAPND